MNLKEMNDTQLGELRDRLARRWNTTMGALMVVTLLSLGAVLWLFFML